MLAPSLLKSWIDGAWAGKSALALVKVLFWKAINLGLDSWILSALACVALSVVFLLALVFLCRTAIRFVRQLREAVVLRLPVSARQELTLPGGGRYELFLERAWLSRDFTRARFWMQNGEGEAILLRPATFKYEIGTLIATRQLQWSFETPADGRLVLFMDGAANPPGRRSCIVIQRPVGMMFMKYLLMLLCLGLTTVWSAISVSWAWALL